MSVPSPGKCCLIAATVATVLLCVQPVRGETRVALQSHSEQVEIVGRVATTTVSQTFVNYTRERQEVVVRFRLPPGAAVSDLAMWVEGLRSPAVLHPRLSAKQIYREIRDAKRDPALLEYLGAEMWRLSVFPVLPNETQKIEFTFTSVLGGRDGRCVYRGMTVVGGSFTKAVNFECAANIRCRGGIKDVHAVSDALGVQRIKDRIKLGFRATARKLKTPAAFSFTPKVTLSNVVPFKGADGKQYYAAVLDPSWKTPETESVGREVVIVVDASASMKGKSFNIAAKTVKAILADLTDWDEFNVIVTGSDVGVFNEKLLPASAAGKLRAIKWLAGFMPKGATDLAGALRAVESLNKNTKSPLNVFLVTDGRDSIGARCAKKETSPFLTVAEKLPKRPPANCRFFVCDIAGSGTVLEFLAESTGGRVAYIYDNDSTDVAGYIRPLLDASKIADPITGVTLREIPAKGSKQTALGEVGLSRPDSVNGIVISGLWPGPGKRTLEVMLHRGERGQPIKYVLNFPKNDAATGGKDLQKVWAHQRADKMWAKLHSIHVKIDDVQALMDFSRARGIITRAMAAIVLESDEDYIKRGIKRTGSSVTVEKSLTQLSTRKLLAEIVRDDPSQDDDFFTDSRQLSAIKQQAHELQRCGEIAAAARLFNKIAGANPGQFEARRRASLIGEYLALKKGFDANERDRKYNDKRLATLVGGGQWHDMVMRTEPIALAIPGLGATSIAPTPPATLARAGNTPPPASEAREDKLLARKISKLDMKKTALKDVLAALATTRDKFNIRWDQLAMVDIKPSTAITVKMENVTLDEALSNVLAAAVKVSSENDNNTWRGGLDFRVDENRITISSRRDLGVNTCIRTYDIQDLVAYSLNRDRRRLGLSGSDGQTRSLIRARERGLAVGGFSSDSGLFGVGGGRDSSSTGLFDAGAAGDSEGSSLESGLAGGWDNSWSDAGIEGDSDTGLFDPGAGGDYFYEGDLRSPSECTAEITTMLSDMVNRDSWRDAGGEAGAMTALNGVLTIQQTRANHKAIARILENMREMWRKRTPVQITAISDTQRFRGPGQDQLEDPFTAKGQINKWLIDLLHRVAAGKLSKFSSVRIEKIGPRTFARICGVWFDTSLTAQCRTYAVQTGSPAHAALLKADKTIGKCLALGRIVIVKTDSDSAIYLNNDGISKADDKQLKKMIATLIKLPAKR